MKNYDKPSHPKFNAKAFYNKDYWEGNTSTVFSEKTKLAKNDLYPALVDIVGATIGLPKGAWWKSDIRRTYWYGMKVLDIGCGMGATIQAICKRYGDAYGVDISEYAIKNNLQPRRVQCVAVENGLPCSDESFDFVYSSQLLEHIYAGDVQEVFLEIYRVLKPNGFFYADYKEGMPEQDGKDSDPGHQTMRPHWWWQEKLGQVKFVPMPMIARQIKQHRVYKEYKLSVLFALKETA